MALQRHSLTHPFPCIHPCTLKKKKKNRRKKEKNAELTKHDAFVDGFSSCPVCWWETFRKLGTCSTSEALPPRTVLTETICESLQQIFQYSPVEKKNAQLTKHDAFLYWSSFCPLRWWATARMLGRCSSGLFHVGGLLA